MQPALGILVAVVLATLSLLHQHALIPDDPSPAPCVVCAFGADVTVAPPQPVAPVVVVYVLPAPRTESFSSRSFVAVPARAPPSAA